MKKNWFTKQLAVAGTILAGLPIAAPIIFAILSLVMDGRFRFDYLMPAELFPFALAGGLLLLWAAIRARTRLKLIGWSLGIAVGMLVGGQALAVVTGLASGETKPAGLPWALVLGSLIAFTFALIAVGVGGIMLLIDLFKTKKES